MALLPQDRSSHHGLGTWSAKSTPEVIRKWQRLKSLQAEPPEKKTLVSSIKGQLPLFISRTPSSRRRCLVLARWGCSQPVHVRGSVNHSPSVAISWAAAEMVYWSVVDKVPDQPAHKAVRGLIRDAGLDDLLLHSGDACPSNGVACALLPVGSGDEAGIIWTQGRCEHASTPWPMHVMEGHWSPAAVVIAVLERDLVDLLQVTKSNDGLLFTWIGDLWHWWDWPLIWLLAWGLDARVVAVSDSEDARLSLVVGTPNLALASLHRKLHVHKDPAATTWTFSDRVSLGMK